MTEEAETIIRVFEGLRLKAYQDSVGVWTIGYGHTGKDVTPGKQISIERAEQLLKADLAVIEEEIGALVKVPLNANQLAALESFIYNMGIKAFADSTLFKMLNDGDYDGAAGQFHRWIYAGKNILQGLVKRRAAEVKLFLTPNGDES